MLTMLNELLNELAKREARWMETQRVSGSDGEREGRDVDRVERRVTLGLNAGMKERVKVSVAPQSTTKHDASKQTCFSVSSVERQPPPLEDLSAPGTV